MGDAGPGGMGKERFTEDTGFPDDRDPWGKMRGVVPTSPRARSCSQQGLEAPKKRTWFP